MEYLSADLEIKTLDVPRRIISGYACVHNTVDRVHDVIDPTASAKAVARLGNPADIAVFVGHDTKSLPVGIPQVIEATPQGLYTETYILKGRDGDNLLATAKDLLDHGQSLGMSIGFKTRDSRYEPAGAAGKKVRRLLDYELKEYSFAAAQAIAHPEALVASVKTKREAAATAVTPAGTPRAAAAASAPAALSVPSTTTMPARGVRAKTQPSKGAADRAARRQRAEAERRACDLEEQRERAEQELARARLAELRAQNEELGRFVVDEQRRQVDEELAAREKREETVRRMRAELAKPLPTLHRSMEEIRATFAEVGRYLERHEQAERDEQRAYIDQCESRRRWDWDFRRGYDRRHPGGGDHCTCDAHRAWRGEPPR
jgi:HK97 family phage prohead protease